MLKEAERFCALGYRSPTLPVGSFQHGDHKEASSYLGDTLSMGEAFLALYEVWADRNWLKQAEASATSSQPTLSCLLVRVWNLKDFDRSGLQAASRTGRKFAGRPFREFALPVHRRRNRPGSVKAGDALFANPEVAIAWLSAPVLLAENPFMQSPVHITVVGSKQDPSAQLLFATALMASPLYKRVEWWDRSEGALPRADIQYPVLPTAAMFLYTASACSSPIEDVHLLQDRLSQTARPAQ